MKPVTGRPTTRSKTMDRINELKKELLDELEKTCSGSKVSHLTQLLIDGNNSKELTINAGMIMFLTCGVLADSYKKKNETSYDGFMRAAKAINKVMVTSVQAEEAFDVIADLKGEFYIDKNN